MRAECLGQDHTLPVLPASGPADSSWRHKQGCLWWQERSFRPKVEFGVTVVSLSVLG